MEQILADASDDYKAVANAGKPLLTLPPMLITLFDVFILTTKKSPPDTLGY
jgi:hypothetical protein